MANSSFVSGFTQSGKIDNANFGRQAMAEEIEREAMAICFSRNEELVLLKHYFVAIVAKELRKQRADNLFPEYASLSLYEQSFWLQLKRTLVDVGLALDQ